MDIIADGAITVGIVAIGTIAIGAIVSGVTIALGEMATTVVAITTIAPMRDRTTVPPIVGRMRTALACAGGKLDALKIKKRQGLNPGVFYCDVGITRGLRDELYLRFRSRR